MYLLKQKGIEHAVRYYSANQPHLKVDDTSAIRKYLTKRGGNAIGNTIRFRDTSYASISDNTLSASGGEAQAILRGLVAHQQATPTELAAWQQVASITADLRAHFAEKDSTIAIGL